MSSDNDLHNQIANALTGLVKQIKAIRYYPPKHPALQTTAEESLRGFQPLLDGGNHLGIMVRKEGFLFDDQPIAKTNQALTQLATFFFARRIQYLTILSDLTAFDLHHFIHYLILDPQDIQKHGGIQSLLEKGRVTTIWTNEQDLDAILDRKEELEAEPAEEQLDPSEVLAQGEQAHQEQEVAQGPDLNELLKQLDKAKDDRTFNAILQEVIPQIRLNLVPEHQHSILGAFLLLCRNATGKQLSEARRESARQALEQLTASEACGYLITYLLSDQVDEKSRSTLVQVMIFLREKFVAPLMDRLAEEKGAAQRKLLTEVLVKSGPAAIPILQEYLVDERWFVLRNAISILGEIRSPESLPHLVSLMEHDDMRVRRETIRALTKIGGQRAINVLLHTVESGDQELRRHALLSLGALRAESAVPTLLMILKQGDWKQNTMELKKDAIRALGEIRSADALPDLKRIVAKRRLFRRNLHDELRIVAASALGEIGDESVRDLLEKVTDDRSSAVARAAANALKQLDKAAQ